MQKRIQKATMMQTPASYFHVLSRVWSVLRLNNLKNLLWERQSGTIQRMGSEWMCIYTALAITQFRFPQVALSSRTVFSILCGDS